MSGCLGIIKHNAALGTGVLGRRNMKSIKREISQRSCGVDVKRSVLESGFGDE